MLISTLGFGQSHELNFGSGFAYYYGDLNTVNSSGITTVFGESFNTKNFKLSFSLGYRYNFKSIFSLGLNFYHMNLAGYDSDNESATPADEGYSRKLRNLSFFTKVNQGFVDLKIEPFRTQKRWVEQKFLVSPYIGGGIGLFQFNPKTMYNGAEVELQPLGTEGQGLPGYKEKYKLSELVIPVSLGVKFYMPKRKFAINLDFNYNHTFTDYIDDVSTVYADPADFQAAYQTSDPNKYALVTALSDRGLIQHAVGETRGHENYDFFLTGQIKFCFLIDDLIGGANYYQYNGYR